MVGIFNLGLYGDDNNDYDDNDDDHGDDIEVDDYCADDVGGDCKKMMPMRTRRMSSSALLEPKPTKIWCDKVRLVDDKIGKKIQLRCVYTTSWLFIRLSINVLARVTVD